MRSVLVTGSSKGIGYEIAIAFAHAGYRVFATMRNPSGSPALAEKAAAESLPIFVSAMDVDRDDSVANAIAAIQSKHGPIDILINNAGVDRAGSIEEQSLDDFRACMETNYFGAIRCIKAVVPQMRERRSGTIINISSVAGSFSHPPMTAYCSSKWALEAMSESLACEMKSFGVHVALVKPGIIDTSMAHRIGATGHSEYPHAARIAALFSKTLQDAPVPPTVVAQKVLDLVKSGTWQFRHPVGPDAVPLIEWRKSMTDEQWIEHHSAEDENRLKAAQAAGE
ncbi:short-chain dehydrogenase/reductase SDR [Candidatus Koribacter versatilis Ellin345]|uniref:Short-chain dehydrogenase/reductase SDR n=1 Tax=Koribacter versatilis (strain Ellin345) TaxID=204669 RepID=Q1ITJ9_KORVE|nr:SDR family oxidoreductase [Candidatus Koribacter versatilis]ABF39801.1 short-chain dehydrogenase/reductase SDR [Candidatus Koribacter versatilis Ellin345]